MTMKLPPHSDGDGVETYDCAYKTSSSGCLFFPEVLAINARSLNSAITITQPLAEL